MYVSVITFYLLKAVRGTYILYTLSLLTFFQKLFLPAALFFALFPICKVEGTTFFYLLLNHVKRVEISNGDEVNIPSR